MRATPLGVGVDAVVLGAPSSDQLAQLRVDLSAALAEQLPQPVGHAAQVTDPVLTLDPLDAEPHRQLGAQGGVVDPADRALLVLQESGIEGQPASRVVLDL